MMSVSMVKIASPHQWEELEICLDSSEIGRLLYHGCAECHRPQVSSLKFNHVKNG